MEKNDKTPMLHKDKKNAQDITNQDYPGEPNSKPDQAEKPIKENPKKVQPYQNQHFWAKKKHVLKTLKIVFLIKLINCYIYQSFIF